MELTQEQLTEMLDAAADKAVKAVVASIPASNPGGVQVVEDEADRALKGNPYKSFGDFLLDVRRAAVGGGVDKRLIAIKEHAVKQLGMNEGLPSEGGFLVQQDLMAGVLQRAYNNGALASRIRRITVGPNSNGLKVNMIAEASRVRASRGGGLDTWWVGEAGTITPTMPAIRQFVLDLKKLVGAYYATSELEQDAAALGSVVDGLFADEIAYRLDDAILNGTGAGQPLGVLNSPALVTQAAEGGQLADTIVVENIVKMYSRLWTGSRNSPSLAWFYNQDIEPQLFTMTIAGVTPVFMPANGIAGKPYATIMGIPAIAVEQASTIGNVGDIVLADLGQYWGIDKGGVQTASSIHVAFLTDQNCYRFVYRFDGAPTWVSPLTPATGVAASTLSPFVALAAR